MKRKVIKLAGTTYVVSLPLKWARENKVEKGDEVEVEPQGNKLILSFGRLEKTSQKAEVDMKDLVGVPARYVTALYRKGTDEIVLHYSKPDTFSAIQSALSLQTIGLEIVSQKKDSCVIKDLSGYESQEFGQVLRRIWLLTLEMANDSLDCILKGDNEGLRNMFHRDRVVNKFSNYCCRILLNDRSLPEYKRIVSFHFVRSLRLLADIYKNLSLYAEKKSVHMPKDMNSFFKRVNGLMHSFYEFFYSYSDTDLEVLLGQTEELKNELEAKFDKNLSTHASMMYHYLFSVVHSVRNLLSTVLELNLSE